MKTRIEHFEEMTRSARETLATYPQHRDDNAMIAARAIITAIAKPVIIDAMNEITDDADFPYVTDGDARFNIDSVENISDEVVIFNAAMSILKTVQEHGAGQELVWTVRAVTFGRIGLSSATK